MIYKLGIIIFIYLFVACSSAERKEAVTVGELFRQAAFYGERLQYIPALDTYQQAIRLAEKDKDSLALSHGYLEMGKIYRNQSLKQKALQSEKKALSYLGSAGGDSLRTVLYREMGDIYMLSRMPDSAFYYYQMGDCRIKQTKVLQQGGKYKESEALLKTELEQTIPQEEKAELFLALADLQINMGKLEEAETNLSQVPSSHPHLYATLSRIAQCRGDSLQADFYQKNYLHNLSVLRRQQEDNQITQLLWTSEQKEWERRLSNAENTQTGRLYLWSALFILCGTSLLGYSRYRKKKAAVSLSETDFLSSEVYQRFHRKEEWRAGSKDWEELLQAFNRTYPEFRERLKKKIPKLSEQEWRMCCLIKMDVPPSIMAMLLCCTNQAISMRRVRLYQKMTGEKGTPELCDSFIRDF